MDLENGHTGYEVGVLDRVKSAFLGAAAGDALGWPNELNAKNIDAMTSGRPVPIANGFIKWRRREGGRWYAHEETVEAGEYSDDTQLLLATARCVVREAEWWEQFTRAELPLWTAYERGGGGATKRAADAWLRGREPWGTARSTPRKQYVEAGGNGVAMRIMPHCARGTGATTFAGVAEEIVANGIATHGHPRALVGALAYGFALWLAFRSTGTLGFGSLISDVHDASSVWAPVPNLDEFCPKWRVEVADEKYLKSWSAVVDEMLELLRTCKAAIGQGVASDTDGLLSDIGCYDAQRLGAGTVAAAAAIYFASRWAAQPLLGVREAAYMRGTDTDTIASMTGGLLGALHGNTEWMDGMDEVVQDSVYIRGISETVVAGGKSGAPKDPVRVTASLLEKLKSQLAVADAEGSIPLPFGGSARVVESKRLTSLQDGINVRRWKLHILGGQSVYMKKLERSSKQVGLGLAGEDRTHKLGMATSRQQRPPSEESARVIVRLDVRDPARVRRFYDEILGCSSEENA